MKTILFMTVGTGTGDSPEKIDSLAHGLLYSIKDTNPSHTLFFGSELSKKTVESLKKQFFKEFNFEFQDYDFVLLNDIDNFNECFDKYKEKLTEYEDSIIKIDYTSGTKTMTMSAAICATIYRKDLFLVAGERGKDGIVKKDTEYKRVQNLYKIYDKFTLDKIKDAFNHNRFETGIELLEETRDIENKDSFLKLLQLYNFWDKFNHKEADKIFKNEFDKEFKHFPELQNKLGINKAVIDKIVNPKKERLGYYYILADLLNNAVRRGEEGKYDDAIARLYRSLELIAQIKLKTEYGIITSDVDIKKVREYVKNSEYINKLIQNNSLEDKIRLGSKNSFKLLKELNDSLGQAYEKRKGKIKDSLKLRNKSILAHGCENRTEEEYNRFKSFVIELSNELDENIEKRYMKEAEFPKFY
ncbi:MAG: TIGR02710 family CRISPR-associated CARF protein [Methanobrevibacter sp.]|nr:TIGR02710 family CRISPR-associated CARF protein [Methanobrevibacter sp.]